MTIIRGGVAGPDGVGGAYQNEVETDRAAWWYAMGGVQGVLKGFTHAGVAGQMALDFTAGAALVSERDASGNVQDRGYFVWSDATTRVSFGPASVAARNDAVVVAFVDTEDGPVGTGALDVGPHIVVVPGVSGTTTPVSDASITSYLGRGGWVRRLNVPIAASDTQINTANITLAASSILNAVKQTAGQVAVSFTALDVYTVRVDFGVTFDKAPAVFTNIATSSGAAPRWISRAYAVDTTGFTLYVAAPNAGSTQTWSNLPVQWTATSLG